jgi:hypothetical protein
MRLAQVQRTVGASVNREAEVRRKEPRRFICTRQPRQAEKGRNGESRAKSRSLDRLSNGYFGFLKSSAAKSVCRLNGRLTFTLLAAPTSTAPPLQPKPSTRTRTRSHSTHHTRAFAETADPNVCRRRHCVGQTRRAGGGPRGAGGRQGGHASAVAGRGRRGHSQRHSDVRLCLMFAFMS